MKKKKIIILLSCVVCTQAVGSLSVTLAWYQYTASTQLSYNGCTVNKTDSVQVGIRSDVILDYDDAMALGLLYDSTATKYFVYWPATELTSDQIEYVMNANGYAFNVLNATTSSTFHNGDTFKIHDAPNECSNGNLLFNAKKQSYVQLNLVFKSGGGGSSVYLDDFSFVNTGDLYNAFRIYMKSNTLNGIFNPSSNLDGKTVVGGKLDLNNDEIFDYSPVSSQQQEFFYGKYLPGTLVYETTPNTTGAAAVSNPGDYNVFTGDTLIGNYTWDESIIKYETADYLGRTSVMNGVQSLCDFDGAGYAYVDMTCYLEGWDHSLIDINSTNMFDAKFTFVS